MERWVPLTYLCAQREPRPLADAVDENPRTKRGARNHVEGWLGIASALAITPFLRGRRVLARSNRVAQAYSAYRLPGRFV